MDILTTLSAAASGLANIAVDQINSAVAASSPALLQELVSASEQLARSTSALKLPVAPLPLIPLPSHQKHEYKATIRDAQPSSVTVSSDAADILAEAVIIPAIPPAVQVPKVVIEYPVPGARETHEMAVVGPNMLLLTQQSNSHLLKILLSPTTGRPISCTRYLMADFWAGLHGLFASQYFENQVWASLQFMSLLIRIEPGLTMYSTPVIRQVITLPASVKGPHCVYECGPDLWTGCKDSDHIVRINYSDPSDYSVYPCSAHPIFMARHPTSQDMYASLDSSSKIWRLVVSKDETVEMDIPSTYGNTPVGLVAGTDGNVWFTLLGGSSGGSGTFARILSSGDFQWFTLSTPIAADAGLIHLAFDWHEHFQRKLTEGSTNRELHRLWLLSSTLVADAGNSIDAVFSVLVDTKLGRITTEQSITLPTQRCATHRVLPHRTGLFVSELQVSLLAHITGAAAFNVEGVPGETTDYYGHFGLGVPIPSYTFDLELPKTQRIPTRNVPCPLPSKRSVLEEAKGDQSASTRVSKRTRVSSAG